MTEPSNSAPPACEVPDLDLGALPPPRAPAARPPHARPAPAQPASGAHPIRQRAKSTPDPTDELEFDLGSNASFELAFEASAPPLGRRSEGAYLGSTLASVDGDFEFDEAMALEAVAATEDTKTWPLGRSSEAKLGLMTPESIVERAGYGDANLPFYLAPAYTWRVWNRRRLLAAEVVTRQRELASREVERDRVLVELTLSLTTVLGKQERFREILAELAAASETYQGHERALAGTNAAISRELAVHDAELARLEVERVERAQVVAERQRERNDRAISHQRARAKLKRVQIEIRNATEKGRALVGPQGGALPTELAQQLSELGVAEAELVKELAAEQVALDRASDRLAATELPLAEVQAAMDSIRDQKRQLVLCTRQKVESESSQVKGAEAAYTDVAKRIAHAVLDMKGNIPVERTMLDRIQAADDRVETALFEVEKLRLALDAFDRGSYGLGVKVALAPLAFILALVLLGAIL